VISKSAKLFANDGERPTPGQRIVFVKQELAVSPAQSEMKQFRAITNSEGIYKFELPFASYSIEANAAGFCPRRVDLFRPRKSLMQRPLDFVLEVKDNDRPCRQKTMIRKEPPKKPEPYRSIAE